MNHHHHHHHRHSHRSRRAGFWSGRNGLDDLGRFLICVELLLLIPCILIRFWLVYLIWFALLALVACSIFRMLSRNLKRRKKENERYKSYISHVNRFWSFQRQKWEERKTHVFVRCKCCRRILRLPREKGEHTVRCPICCKSFGLKIR